MPSGAQFFTGTHLIITAYYFYHAVSGLEFALLRAYDPTHARWVNRDPIDEAGGVNLYAYVGGTPTGLIDPLGLWSWQGAMSGLASGFVGGGLNGALVGAFGGPEAALGLGVLGAIVGGVTQFIVGGLTDPGTAAAVVGDVVAGALTGGITGTAGAVGGAVSAAIANLVGPSNPAEAEFLGGLGGALGGAISGLGEGEGGAIEGAVVGWLSGITQAEIVVQTACR